ncbi:MAG: hypothetical protein DCF22_00460 [Leptolyngbya sp.]|nr:MAG: hypothetical protein DCF22_00460 [Leptolyngbya sp.]
MPLIWGTQEETTQGANMANKARIILWTSAAAIAIGIVVVGRLRSEPPNPENALAYIPTQQPAQSDESKPGWKTTKEGYIGSPTEEKLDKLISFAASGDKQAFNQMILAGDAIPLKAGTKVQLEQCLGFACSKVKVRPEGSIESIYTIGEAIK